MKTLSEQNYSAHYFLAALGAGGLSVSFFMYLMFMIPHPNTPMPTWTDWTSYLTTASNLASALVIIALGMILLLAFWHVKLLWWNWQEYRNFRRTKTYEKLVNSNEEIGLMTIPLTLAMSINVCFVLGALFIPGLWTVIEWLYPVALLGFSLIGIFALRILTRYFVLAFTGKPLDFTANNSLSPMISMFAFAMIAVGLAAPAAMSHEQTTVAASIILSLFFFTIALLLTIIKLVNGFQSMLLHGINPAASPSLWIMIPILTLLGITWIRLSHGLAHEFQNPLMSASMFTNIVMIISLQLLFGLLGYAVMKRLGYFNDYLHGEKRSPASFSLICPGVALFVFGMFFIHIGLVQTKLLTKWEIAYFIWILPLVVLQLLTLRTFFKLKTRLLT